MFCLNLVLMLGLMVYQVSPAAEPVVSAVERAGERFVLHSQVLIGLPPEQVRTILTRYENLPRINAGIKRVRILERNGRDRVRMQVLAGVCILMFCREYKWVQDVDTLPNGDVVAIMDPAESDFREGRARWQFLAENGCTRLVSDAVLVPDFWYPPLLGPWLIERNLTREALETALGVERMAAAQALTPAPAATCTASPG